MARKESLSPEMQELREDIIRTKAQLHAKETPDGKKPRSINIALVGPAGAGKSATVNTCANAMNVLQTHEPGCKAFREDCAVEQAAGGHGTLGVKCYGKGSIEGEMCGANVTLWDTQGMATNNDRVKVLIDALVYGYLRPGGQDTYEDVAYKYDSPQYKTWQTMREKDGARLGIYDRPHCLVFTIRADPETGKHWNILDAIHNWLTRQPQPTIKVLIALTHLDKLDSSLKKNPEKVHTSEEVETFIRRITGDVDDSDSDDSDSDDDSDASGGDEVAQEKSEKLEPKKKGKIKIEPLKTEKGCTEYRRSDIKMIINGRHVFKKQYVKTGRKLIAVDGLAMDLLRQAYFSGDKYLSRLEALEQQAAEKSDVRTSNRSPSNAPSRGGSARGGSPDAEPRQVPKAGGIPRGSRRGRQRGSRDGSREPDQERTSKRMTRPVSRVRDQSDDEDDDCGRL